MGIARKILQMINEANIEQYRNMFDFAKKWKERYGYGAVYDRMEEHFLFLKENRVDKPMAVSWVLKWLSIIILANIIDKCRSYALKYKDEIKAEAEKEINKKFKWSFMSGGKTEAFSYNSALDSMESSGTRGGFLDTFIHYWNYGYDEIRNYAYPSNMTPKQVFSEFDAIIEKKELKTKFHVNEKEEKKKYGNKMYDFISFDDGWKWVMKEVN